MINKLIRNRAMNGQSNNDFFKNIEIEIIDHLLTKYEKLEPVDLSGIRILMDL